jgi:hypothetical protein
LLGYFCPLAIVTSALKFLAIMALTVITVEKNDLLKNPGFEIEVQPFCIQRKEKDDLVIFVPRPGFLMPLVVLLSERKISYKVEFESD